MLKSDWQVMDWQERVNWYFWELQVVSANSYSTIGYDAHRYFLHKQYYATMIPTHYLKSHNSKLFLYRCLSLIVFFYFVHNIKKKAHPERAVLREAGWACWCKGKWIFPNRQKITSKTCMKLYQLSQIPNCYTNL